MANERHIPLVVNDAKTFCNLKFGDPIPSS
jgi:hypothetical protein